MKDREETIAFEMNYCQHYEPKHGIGNDANWCNAGCDINALRIKPTQEEQARGIFGQPCIKGHLLPDATAVCPSWIRRTREMGEARADGIEKFWKNMQVVGPVVSEWRKGWSKKNRVGKAEVIECPACKGKLHLSQAAVNGHVHVLCETAGCVSWIE